MVKPLKGITCPRHPDAKLRVLSTRRVDTGVVERYRRCSVKGCTFRIFTEERIRPAAGCRKANSPL